jgi:hypothetical protein
MRTQPSSRSEQTCLKSGQSRAGKQLLERLYFFSLKTRSLWLRKTAVLRQKGRLELLDWPAELRETSTTPRGLERKCLITCGMMLRLSARAYIRLRSRGPIWSQRGQRGGRRTRPRSCRTQKGLHALHAAERHPDNRAAWSCDGDRNGGGTARRGGAIYPVRLGRSSPGTTNWTASLRLKYSTSDADP